MSHMYDEIHEQAKVIKHIKKHIKNELLNIEKRLNNTKIKCVILAARGSSDNACQYFRYLTEIYAGIPVSFSAPSVISIYKGDINYDSCLVIGVSQSGQAQDVLEVMKIAKSQNSFVIALTNNEDSPMAKLADIHLNLSVGKELSVAATKTFTAELYCLLELANIISMHKLDHLIPLVPQVIEDVLTRENQIFHIANNYIHVEESYVLARGFLYSIALESALKIQEACYINSKAYAISDFHHGPFAVLDSESHVIIFLKKGPTYQNGIDMIKKMKLTFSDLIVVTDSVIDGIDSDHILMLPEVDEAISPFAYIIAMQLFAYKLSLLRGIDADQPRGLKKVTITK